MKTFVAECHLQTADGSLSDLLSVWREELCTEQKVQDPELSPVGRQTEEERERMRNFRQRQTVCDQASMSGTTGELLRVFRIRFQV